MAPDPSKLEDCPAEIIECLTRLLDRADLGSLRRTSKTLAVMVAQETFKHCYRTKHVDVSPESLAAFARMTQAGLLGSAELEHLELTGVAVDTQHLTQIVEEKARWETEGFGGLCASTQHMLSDAELLKAREDLARLERRKVELEAFSRSDTAARLLTEAFSNIVKYGKRCMLPSLTLEVVVVQEDLGERVQPVETQSLHLVWEAAEATFWAAMRGLSQSGMPLEKLDVFTGQYHCSLGWSALARMQELRGPLLGKALGSLQYLSISLSANPQGKKSVNNGSHESSVGLDQPGDPIDAADFFSLCPRVTQLHLHWFLLKSAGSGNHATERMRAGAISNQAFNSVQNLAMERMLARAVSKQAFNSVQHLALRGARFKGPDVLLELLKAAPICELRLENVHVSDPQPLSEDHNNDDTVQRAPGGPPLSDGVTSVAWNAVFAYCTSREANMSSLFFDDLWGKRLLHFMGQPKRYRKMPWTPSLGGVETLERNGIEEVRTEIEYAYTRGRPSGSPQAFRWRQKTMMEYGPPPLV